MFDGTSSELVYDVNTTGSSDANLIGELDGVFYFGADNGVSGHELWRYDGTDAILVYDIWPGSTSSYPETNFNAPAFVADGKMFFTAESALYGRELWYFDGTTATMVGDIASGTADSYVYPQGVLNDVFYFQAELDGYGKELFKYEDGTASLLVDLYPGATGSEIYAVLRHSVDGIYFVATDDVHGRELWHIENPYLEINEPLESTMTMVYPNPGNGEFTVELPSEFNEVSLNVFDLTGKAVFSSTFKNMGLMNFDLSLDNGIYLVQAEDLQSGEKQVVKYQVLN